jgi:transcriptional regulator with XRE-family HTH domain
VRSQPPTEPDISARIASAIRSTCQTFGWSQRELARRLETNQSAIRRLESEGGTIDARLATAALDLLGIRLIIDANPIGLAGRREQRDLVHARCVGYAVQQLSRRGWEVRTEVEIGDGRFRGWIDVLAYRESDGALLIIEIKTEIDDFGRILRSLGWYVRSSRDAARADGWRPRVLVPVLIALATAETDARLVGSGDLVRHDLPGGADALAAWIGDPSAPGPTPTVALVDPASRRSAWLRRTRLDGRRSAAPYRDYADAARRLRRATRTPRATTAAATSRSPAIANGSPFVPAGGDA